VLCPLLVFGFGSFAGWGVAGAAASTVTANLLASLLLVAFLLQRDATVYLRRVPWHFHSDLLRDILRVGLPGSLSPIISNTSIAVSTVLVGSYGTAALAGYGVA